ncbi:MAG: cytochrome c [Chloroflexi bacterium]|nr:cytochrome c [Chloroflexota bacterium]
MKQSRMWAGVSLLAAGLLLFLAAPASAGRPAQFDDPLEQGEYLVNAVCMGCHTPLLPDSFTESDMSRYLAGGQPFDLGPLGVVFSKNLTSDVETGLGGWTDEEIKTAIRTGVSRDGLHLFPIMPYPWFNSMADSDLDAIVAYLRTVPAINNAVPRVQILPPEALPQLPMQSGIVAPDNSDPVARGRYLVMSVFPCSDCHTPADPETGAPQFELFLSGGQPFEGPWGIVYGGNITPDEETGIGAWTDEQIVRVMTEGIRPDGRVVVLMPSHEIARLTAEDVDAIVAFLREGVQPVNRVVPEAALNEGFIQYVEIEESPMGGNNNVIIGLVLVGVLLLAAFGVYQNSKRKKPEGS